MKGEVKKNAKPKKTRAIKFCPRCGSTDVFWAQGLPQLWSLWECHICGYRGPVILEDGEMAEKLQEDYQRNHPQQTRKLEESST